MKLAGAELQRIADALGYSSRAAACKDISRAYEIAVAETAQYSETLREQELQRLDRLQVGVWAAALAGDPRAADTALKIIDRRIKLLGLDAPTRYEVITLDAIEQEIQRLSAELGQVGSVDTVAEAETGPAPGPA
jgi:hypothetical protein